MNKYVDDNQQAKILIIDDEEIVRESCERILRKSDYLLATAADGLEGLEKVKAVDPDLVLVDLKMPGMSGFEVLEEIKAYDHTIVTIVITGFATVNSAVESMKKGTYDFLPKPFKPDELRLTIRRGLEKRKLLLETIALRKEKEMLREHFAAIVSHELKSPLGALQQNLYVLKEDLADKLNEKQMDRVKSLQNRIKDLINLVNTWLRVISVDISNIQEKFQLVSLDQVIHKAVENVELQATKKDIDIHMPEEKTGIQVEGDEGTLVEAFGNLLSNAIKYSHMGKEIKVEILRCQPEIFIKIIDQGVGIDQEDLPHLFEDFYRGKIKVKGERSSGIGLAITQRIIEAHGGTISVESEVGQGSTFTVQLAEKKNQEQTQG